MDFYSESLYLCIVLSEPSTKLTKMLRLSSDTLLVIFLSKYYINSLSKSSNSKNFPLLYSSFKIIYIKLFFFKS